MASSDQTFFVREKEVIKVLNFDHNKAEDSFEKQEPIISLPTPKASLWSPDGLLLALADQTNGVQVVEVAKGANGVHTLPGSSKTTQSLQWSPNSKVLVAISPADKKATDPNVLIFTVDFKGGNSSMSLSASFLYPKLEKDKKIFQWTPDSNLCARLCQDGNVHIVDGSDLGGEVLTELALAHSVQNFEFAPQSPNPSKARLAIFVPDVRDDMQRVTGPAEVTIWELTSSGTGEDLVVSPNRKAVASVGSGQISDIKWNNTGSALLAHCQTEVDETGASYYGGSKLLFLSCDGSYQNELTDSEEGSPNGTSVQAVEWSPTRDEFILIRGFQPAQATLWSWDVQAQKAALKQILLEKAHRNTIRYNSFGSLVCLAGFGNLAGDVDFFGRRAGDKLDYARISSCQANCTVSAEWSPDGRHFLTAVLAPRMRVDNGIGVWRALTGSRVSDAKFEELFDAQWRPETKGKPRFADVGSDEVEQAVKDLSGDKQAVPKKQAYRPPKARGESGGNVAAMMRGEMAPDPMDDRRSRKPRDPLRPPVRRDEDAHSPDDQQDRRGSRDAKETEPAVARVPSPAADGAGPGKAAARRPPPPDAPVPTPPPPKNPSFYDPSAGYPQHQQAPKAPAPAAYQAQAKPVPVQQQPVHQAPAPAPRKAAAPVQQQPWQPKAGGLRGLEEMGMGRNSQQVSHGEKLPCPATGWQYVDPKQNIQGPFTLLEMQQWNAMGYFRPNLMMRCDPADRFMPFGELFPHPLIPFQSYPKRGMNMR